MHARHLSARNGLLAVLGVAALAQCTGAIDGGAGQPPAGELPPGSQPGQSPTAPGTTAPPSSMPAPMSMPGAMTPATPTAAAPILCSASSGPAPTPLRRLSRREYLNTVLRVMGGGNSLLSIDGHDRSAGLVGKMAPVTAGVPPELGGDFARLDQTVSIAHVDGYFMMAAGAGSGLGTDLGFLRKYGGNCVSAPDAACVDGFVTKFGLRALRRPLTAAEVHDYHVIYDENATSPADGFGAVIEAMFMAPQFLYQVEVDGTPVSGRNDLLRISDFELASRLSYRIDLNAPSDELLAAAAAGKLADDAEYRKWVDTAFTFSPTRTIDRFFYPAMSAFEQTLDRFHVEWLDIKSPTFSGTGSFGKFLGEYGWQPLAWDVQGSPDFLADEVRDLLYRLTLRENGAVPDIYTANTITTGDRLKTFYGQLMPGPSAELSVVPNHAGLVTRAAFLPAAGDFANNPIKRGVKIRRRLLCDDLPDPDPDKLPDRSLNTPDSTPAKTTRDRYAEKTAAPLCQACHAQINPLGFALEDFDTLSRKRSYEPVYQETLTKGGTSTTRVGMPAVNAAVMGLGITAGDNISVNGGLELSQALAKSSKTTECYARQVFRYTNARRETADDGCVLKAMVDALAPGKGGLGAMWKSLPLQPEFRLKRLGN